MEVREVLGIEHDKALQRGLRRNRGPLLNPHFSNQQYQCHLLDQLIDDHCSSAGDIPDCSIHTYICQLHGNRASILRIQKTFRIRMENLFTLKFCLESKINYKRAWIVQLLNVGVS